MPGSFVGVADYGSFVAAIIVFLLIPGPGNLALITSTGKGGIAGGLAATLGVIVGDQFLLWAAVAGVSAFSVTGATVVHPASPIIRAVVARRANCLIISKPQTV